jgi:hypothetical protein
MTVPATRECYWQDHTKLPADAICRRCYSPRFEEDTSPGPASSLLSSSLLPLPPPPSGVHTPSVLSAGVVPPPFRSLSDSTYVPAKETFYFGQAGQKLIAKATGRKKTQLVSSMTIGPATQLLAAAAAATANQENGTISAVIQNGAYMTVPASAERSVTPALTMPDSTSITRTKFFVIMWIVDSHDPLIATTEKVIGKTWMISVKNDRRFWRRGVRNVSIFYSETTNAVRNSLSISLSK